MSQPSWPELKQIEEENRHELVIGSMYSKVIEESGVDPFLFSLVNLNYLNINETCLTSVPDDIGRLINLTSLILYSNNISSLPQTIGKLSKLKILDLSRNKLESIPDEISALGQLSTLNLGTNILTKIPSLVKNTKLSILDLSHNQFEEFPDVCHSELIHLSEMKLNGNNIKEVPPTIGQLPAMKMLDLSDNSIATVPGELSDIPKLKEVNLKGNKLSDRRLLKLVDQCHAKQVLDYIRQSCPRVTGVAASGHGGKGKKGKKGKKAEHSESTNHTSETIEQLCHKMEVIHVSDSTPSVKIIDGVKSVRPFIVCCIVRNLNFTPDSFKKFIQMQTKLHDTVCDHRNSATIATHDLDLLPPGDLVYTAMPPNVLKIHPLSRTREYTGLELFLQLQKEADELRKEKKHNIYSGIHKYLYLVEGKSLFPCLLDSTERVISFPPITNSDISKMSASTKSMLVEVTSTINQSTCRSVADALLRETLQLGVSCTADQATDPEKVNGRMYQSLTVEQVKIVDIEGSLKSVYPARNDLMFEGSQQIVVVRK
ncbi:leucine-rich repeat-containing protein 47-like [Schistocerca gregaria]|uniref:leucine-rich repeat-containing protein 47-like n=1 Tax=Schistocerca gregaria TaxID=7010 RepID=UPI00211E65D9|nr:leucine-rich repeat-containing protein 47-like [Schistocerca gregaria]